MFISSYLFQLVFFKKTLEIIKYEFYMPLERGTAQPIKRKRRCSQAKISEIPCGPTIYTKADDQVKMRGFKEASSGCVPACCVCVGGGGVNMR